MEQEEYGIHLSYNPRPALVGLIFSCRACLSGCLRGASTTPYSSFTPSRVLCCCPFSSLLWPSRGLLDRYALSCERSNEFLCSRCVVQVKLEKVEIARPEQYCDLLLRTHLYPGIVCVSGGDRLVGLHRLVQTVAGIG